MLHDTEQKAIHGICLDEVTCKIPKDDGVVKSKISFSNDCEKSTKSVILFTLKPQCIIHLRAIM